MIRDRRMEVVEVDTESTPPSPPRFSVVPARNLAWSAAACAVTSRMSQPGLGPMATGFPRIQHQHPLPHLPPRPLPPSCLELSPHMSPKMHTTAMDKKAPFAESSVDEQFRNNLTTSFSGKLSNVKRHSKRQNWRIER